MQHDIVHVPVMISGAAAANHQKPPPYVAIVFTVNLKTGQISL